MTEFNGESSDGSQPQEPDSPEHRYSLLDTVRSTLKVAGALGAVTLALAAAHELKNPPGHLESGPALLAAPACFTPNAAGMRVIDKMFTPVPRPNYINTGLVAQEHGLTTYDNLAGSNNVLAFQPHDTVAGLRKYIKDANEFFKPYGLSVHAGTKAFAKNGWQTPSAKELMDQRTADDIESMIDDLSSSPTDYVKLTGVHDILLMYNSGDIRADIGDDHSIIYNVAHGPYDFDSYLQTSPLNQLLYRYIDWKENCDVKDPAFVALNGRNVYGPHHHRGLVPEDSYAGSLVSEWDYEKDLAAKKGDRKEYCRLDNKIRQEEKKMAVFGEQDFDWVVQDKADIASTALLSEVTLGYSLDPSTPILRNKVLLELARLRKLKQGTQPVGKQIVDYLADIASYPKTNRSAFDCDK